MCQKKKRRGYASILDHNFKQEENSLKNDESFADVEAHGTIFLEQVYHTKRLHSRVGYMPPAEFEEYAYVTSRSESMMALTMIQRKLKRLAKASDVRSHLQAA